MITNLEAKAIMRDAGRRDALVLQERSENMSGTELYAEDSIIPLFTEAVKVKNMLERKAGQADGFVCKSSAGRVVRLIQNYDSNNYLHADGTPWEPEELPAQYRFVWSKNPARALPFIAIPESYYMTGDCCLNEAGQPMRSKININVWSPDTNPEFWEAASEEVS